MKPFSHAWSEQLSALILNLQLHHTGIKAAPCSTVEETNKMAAALGRLKTRMADMKKVTAYFERKYKIRKTFPVSASRVCVELGRLHCSWKK